MAIGQALAEAVNINLSLLTLGKVIKGLSDKAEVIPYRESKLTRFLQVCHPSRMLHLN